MKLLALMLIGQLADVDAGTRDAGASFNFKADAGVFNFKADAGVFDPYAACAEAPPAEVVDGGFFLPTPRGERLACIQATCEARLKDELAKPPVDAPLLAVTAGVALFLGGAIGFGIASLVKK